MHNPQHMMCGQRPQRHDNARCPFSIRISVCRRCQFCAIVSARWRSEPRHGRQADTLLTSWALALVVASPEHHLTRQEVGDFEFQLRGGEEQEEATEVDGRSAAAEFGQFLPQSPKLIASIALRIHCKQHTTTTQVKLGSPGPASREGRC